MIDINMALNGLKGLKEMAPKKFIADNYQGRGNEDAKEFTETMELAIQAITKMEKLDEIYTDLKLRRDFLKTNHPNDGEIKGIDLALYKMSKILEVQE